MTVRLLGAAMGLAVALLVYAAFIEPNWLRVVSLNLPVQGLGRAFDGFRLVFLSDLHGRASVAGRPISELVSSLRPDLVVIGGDVVARRTGGVAPRWLSLLASEVPTVAVPGNHDHRHGDALAGLSRTVRVLKNTSMRLQRNGSSLWLVGCDDEKSGMADPAAALGGTGRPVILISHSPDVVLHPSVQAVSAVLAGHTHGGQVCLPFFGPVLTNSVLPRRTARGCSVVRGVRLVVTAGIGASYLPFRFLCRPELWLIVLRAERKRPESR
ncbi:MAG: metallophosphoesterase [Bacillota bacterium]